MKEIIVKMAKKRRKRRRSTSEKVMIVLGILIALSMMLSLFIGLGTSGSRGNAPLPFEEFYEIGLVVPAETMNWFQADMPSPLARVLSEPFVPLA
jgi:hypothetical protein